MGLMILTVFLVLVGALALASSAADWRRRQRIIATPTTRIADATGDSVVEIKGRITAGEQGVFTTPFSGQSAVYCRVTVQERRRRGKRTYWHTIIEEVEARDFYVDDGSGQEARVDPRTARAVLDKKSIGSSGTFQDPPPHLMAFLQSRGVASTTWLGTNKSMQYLEEVLSPGDPLFAIGPSHREAGPPVPDGYRMAPSSRLVMSGMGDGDLELLLSNKSEEELTRNLGKGIVVGMVLVGSGAALGLVGFLLGVARHL